MQKTNLRIKRQNKGWSLKYVGDQIGLRKQSIHDIETGKRKPSYKVLIKLCKLFKVNCKEVEQLFEVTDKSSNL